MAFLVACVPLRWLQNCVDFEHFPWERAQILSDFKRDCNPKRLRTTAKTRMTYYILFSLNFQEKFSD